MGATAEGSIDTSTPDEVHESTDVTLSPEVPEGVVTAMAAASPLRPLSFATFMHTIEKKLSKMNKSTENLEKGVKKLKIFKTSKGTGTVKPSSPIKASSEMPSQVESMGAEAGLLSQEEEEVGPGVEEVQEQEMKRRSHQRAEQIKRAREEFLGISTEEVFSAGTSHLGQLGVELRSSVKPTEAMGQNRKSLDVPSLRLYAEGEGNSRSCPSSPRASRSRESPHSNDAKSISPSNDILRKDQNH